MTSLTFGLFGLLLGIAGSSAHASTVPTELDNGMRVVVEERPETETVALRIVMGAGDLDVPPDRRGLADLHARLLSKGTQARSATELARAAEALGGRLFCYSDLRHTTAGLDVPAENLAPAFALLAEIVRTPRFDPADLAKEKALLIAELRGSRDDPSNLVWDETIRTLFPSHRLRQTARLDPADVDAVMLDDITSFHARATAPEKLAVIAVGQCTRSGVERMVTGGFGGPVRHGTGGGDRLRTNEGTPVRGFGIGETPGMDFIAGPIAVDFFDSSALSEFMDVHPRPLAQSTLAPPAPLPADVHRRVHARTTQAQIMAALPTSGVADDQLPIYAVLRFVLGGFEERLSTEIREKRGYAYWLSVTGVTLPDAGWIGVYTGARKRHLEEIEAIIRAELQRIVEAPITQEEMARAKQYLKTTEARIDATNSSRSSALTSSLVDGRPLRSFEERIARLGAVTPAQVQDLARRLFDGKHLAVVTLR